MAGHQEVPVLFVSRWGDCQDAPLSTDFLKKISEFPGVPSCQITKIFAPLTVKAGFPEFPVLFVSRLAVCQVEPLSADFLE